MICLQPILDSDSDVEGDALFRSINMQKSGGAADSSASASTGASPKKDRLTTSEAVEMIRNMLKNAGKRPVGESGSSAEVSSDKTPATTSTDTSTAELTDKDVVSILTDVVSEVLTSGDADGDSSSSNSASDAKQIPLETATTESTTPPAPPTTGFIRAIDPEAGEPVPDVNSFGAALVPFPANTSSGSTTASKILTAAGQKAKEIAGAVVEVEPASKATASGMTCMLKNHR